MYICTIIYIFKPLAFAKYLDTFMEASQAKTSWSDDHLLQLTDPHNHRIRYDRVGYIWEHRLDGKWGLHSVFKYRTHGYYFHLIRFWTYNWSKELMDRRVSMSRSIINGFDSLYKDSKRVKKISEDSSLGVKEKFELIKGILPEEPLSYIADALNISLSTLKRRIK